MLSLSISRTVVSVNFDILKRYYRMYKTQVPEAALNRVSSSLSFLDRSLGERASEIKHKADILSLYLLANSVRTGYLIAGMEQKWKNSYLISLQT